MPHTVLIADDDPPILDLVGQVLMEEGYHVRFAGDGLAALEMALADRPDLILSDLMMPRLDGLTLAARLREQCPAVPVILMSAARPPLAGAAIDFIAKPFSIPHLVAAVAGALATVAAL